MIVCKERHYRNKAYQIPVAREIGRQRGFEHNSELISLRNQGQLKAWGGWGGKKEKEQIVDRAK